MICENCGGEYTETDLFCPYCNKENVIMAEKMKKEKFYQLDREKNEIKKLPQKRIEKNSKIVIMIGITIGIILLLIIIGSYIFSRIKAKREYETQSEQMAVLEEYYQAENIEEMTNYIKENSIYSSKYDKYLKLSMAYEQFERMNKTIDDLIDMTEQEHFLTWDESTQEEYCVSDIYYATHAAIFACTLCKEGIEKYEETEDVEQIQKIYNQCVEKMMSVFCYTQEEIDEMCALEKQSEEYLRPYCQKAYIAWKEAAQ